MSSEHIEGIDKHLQTDRYALISYQYMWRFSNLCNKVSHSYWPWACFMVTSLKFFFFLVYQNIYDMWYTYIYSFLSFQEASWKNFEATLQKSLPLVRWSIVGHLFSLKIPWVQLHFKRNQNNFLPVLIAKGLNSCYLALIFSFQPPNGWHMRPQ